MGKCWVLVMRLGKERGRRAPSARAVVVDLKEHSEEEDYQGQRRTAATGRGFCPSLGLVSGVVG
jgi:hypothetical protein